MHNYLCAVVYTMCICEYSSALDDEAAAVAAVLPLALPG